MDAIRRSRRDKVRYELVKEIIGLGGTIEKTGKTTYLSLTTDEASF